MESDPHGSSYTGSQTGRNHCRLDAVIAALGWDTHRPRPLFRKLHCITSMLGRSNGEAAWRTMGLRLFAGLSISRVIPSVVSVNVERRHNSDHVIYC